MTQIFSVVKMRRIIVHTNGNIKGLHGSVQNAENVKEVEVG